MLFRIGNGFDIHNIVLLTGTKTAEKPFILGGINIDSCIEVDAHSDGDTLIHSLIDGILGALGYEDIGDLFPPSDKQWKDISSLILLEKVLEKTQYKSYWTFNNIDITIVLQTPKLGVLKQEIKDNLKYILGLENIFPLSIKAKTFEEEKSQVWVFTSLSLFLHKM